MNILNKLMVAGLAVLGMGCNSPSTAQPQTPADAAVWHDELAYGFMDTDDSKEAANAFKFAKKNGSYKDFYARFNLGNLYFIEGSTPAPDFVMDANGSGGYMAVLMSQNPRLIPLPDKALFAQFMTALRPAPDKLTADRRNKAIRVLAGTGEMLTKRSMENDSTIERLNIEPADPSWTEENGTLSIDYYSYRSEGNMAPYLVKCQLKVDSSQQFSLTCNRVVEPEPQTLTE